MKLPSASIAVARRTNALAHRARTELCESLSAQRRGLDRSCCGVLADQTSRAGRRVQGPERRVSQAAPMGQRGATDCSSGRQRPPAKSGWPMPGISFALCLRCDACAAGAALPGTHLHRWSLSAPAARRRGTRRARPARSAACAAQQRPGWHTVSPRAAPGEGVSTTWVLGGPGGHDGAGLQPAHS